MNLERAAQKMFRQLDKDKQLTPVVYNQIIGESDYSPVTGETVQESSFSTKAHISEYTQNELSNDVLVTDSKMIAQRTDFTVDPAINDTVLYDNETHRVVSIKNDKTQPTIELQLRAA